MAVDGVCTSAAQRRFSTSIFIAGRSLWMRLLTANHGYFQPSYYRSSTNYFPCCKQRFRWEGPFKTLTMICTGFPVTFSIHSSLRCFTDAHVHWILLWRTINVMRVCLVHRKRVEVRTFIQIKGAEALAIQCRNSFRLWKYTLRMSQLGSTARLYSIIVY